MYAASPENDLLQGDVLRKVPLRRWCGLNEVQGKEGLHTEKTSTATWKDQLLSVVLVSHSCDTAVKNQAKRTRLVVTPLLPLDGGLRKKIEAALTTVDALNRKPEPGQKDFLNLFYFAPHEKLSTVPLIADLSILHSIDRPELKVEMKACQLDEGVREAFRYKVGFNFSRPEDELDDGNGPTAPPPAPPA